MINYLHLQNVFLIPLWNLLPVSFSILPPPLLSSLLPSLSNMTLEETNNILPQFQLNRNNHRGLLKSSSLFNSDCTGVIVKLYQYDQIKNILEPHNCTIYHPIYCQGKNLTIGLKNTPICPKPKVLFFGAIKRSDSNRRFNLCNIMTQNVQNFSCFEGVFGVYLDDLINYASIITLERFYDISSLESHRIDPLLLKGKILISTKSFGKLNYINKLF